MQTCTRIFASVSVLAGLLLGVGIFLATHAPAGAAGVKNGNEHYNPLLADCLATPNPVVLGAGLSSSSNPAGNAQFTFDCRNLTPGYPYTMNWFFSICSSGRYIVLGGTLFVILPTGSQPVTPDNDGRLQMDFQFDNCTPGHGTVNVTNNTTGQVFSMTVILSSPRPAPSRSCLATPNSIVLGASPPGTDNPPGNAEFTFDCRDLAPGHPYTMNWFFSICGSGNIIVAGSVVNGPIAPTGSIPVIPDNDGRLQVDFQFSNCKPGYATVYVINATTGHVVSTTVILSPPLPLCKQGACLA